MSSPLITPKTPRILLAGLFHETHTFLDEVTHWGDFNVLEGDEILLLKGQASPIGAVLSTAQELGWKVLPTIFASATPSGIVADEMIERYWSRFAELAQPYIEQGLDAIYLVLHGAFVSQGFPDVEGELLRRIRALPGCQRLPIFGVYDLHANFSPAMAEHANYLTAYRENPHSDAAESAVRAALALDDCLKTRAVPQQFMAANSIMWPPTGTASQANPMKRLLAKARELELSMPAVLTVNVNAGFSFADTPDTAVSFSLSTIGSEADAKDALKQLVSLANQYAAEGFVKQSDMAPMLEAIMADIQAGTHQGLTVIAEPSDNIGAGAPGDGTGLLGGLVEYEIPNCAVCLWDADNVKRLAQCKIGDRVLLSLGGRGCKLGGVPIELECELLRMCDGLFELEDKQSHLASLCGDRFDMGRCAVVRHAGVTILLTSERTPPMDLGQWRHVGILPESLSVIGVKAAVAHRKAFDPIATRHFLVETPGPCQSDLRLFDFKHVRRPIAPLDELPNARP